MYYLKVKRHDWETNQYRLEVVGRKYRDLKQAVMALGRFSAGCVCRIGSNVPLKVKIDGHFVGGDV